MTRPHDERVKQVAIGIGILIMLTVVVTGLLTGWRLLPGLLGEWVGTMIGIMTTPFFMEASFIILGLVIVIGLNLWRRHEDGARCGWAYGSTTLARSRSIVGGHSRTWGPPPSTSGATGRPTA